MGARGRARRRAEFDIDVIVARLEDLYGELLQARAWSPHAARARARRRDERRRAPHGRSRARRPCHARLAGARAGRDRRLERLQLVDVRLLAPRRRSLLCRLHGAVERRLFRIGADALAPVSLTPSELPSGAGATPELVVWLSEQP